MGLGSFVSKIGNLAKTAYSTVTGGDTKGVVGDALQVGAQLYGGAQQSSALQSSTREQMDFQERMRSTAFQTAVADLKAAGLSPVLAYGNPAATPSGAQTTGIPNIFGEAVSSALAARNARQQNKLLSEQTSATAAQADAARAQALNYKASARSTNADAMYKEAGLPLVGPGVSAAKALGGVLRHPIKSGSKFYRKIIKGAPKK